MNHLDLSTAESISQASCEPQLISHRGFMRHWKRHTLNDQALKKDFYLQKHWCLWSIGRKGDSQDPKRTHLVRDVWFDSTASVQTCQASSL